MEIEELRKLAESFFEWPTEDKTHVTLTSALLFARHVLEQQPAPRPEAVQQPDLDKLNQIRAGLDAEWRNLEELKAGWKEAIAEARLYRQAAQRPEAGKQDGAVIDYGSIDQSHEFIQLFNAAFEALKHGHSIGVCWDLMKAAKAELGKLAKQRPAPRPVPTSERLPTKADADPFGCVLARSQSGKWMLLLWTSVTISDTHWQPTGLVRPAEVPGV